MNRIESLVELFLTELRSNGSPDVDEFCSRFPDFADELRDILPTIALFERGTKSTWPRTDPESHPIPSRIGPYEIVREVGAGGMGVVYEARHLEMGRRVALKVLTTSLTGDTTHRERFQREIRLASSLHHTNIVPVYETGTHAGIPYFTMQFIEGESLENWPSQMKHVSHVERFRLAGEVVRQVADALRYANQQGILHRDIKPSNLLRDRQGTVWITDFGLARQHADGVTRTGDIVGTLRYIAPERFSAEADQRSDIYSLGLTLYELCTLRPAFPEPDQVKLYRDILESQPPRPRNLVPSMPRDLETIIVRSIEQNPKNRYQSAGDLAEDLRLWLDDRPIRSRPVTAWEQLWRWGRRNPVTASLTSAIICMMFLLIGVLTFSAHRRGLVIEELNRSNQTAQLRLYDSYLGRAQASRWSGRPGQNFQAIEAIDQASKLIDVLFTKPSEREAQRLTLRNEAIAAMILTDISSMKHWEFPHNQQFLMVFDQAFTKYASSQSSRNIALKQVSDDSALAQIPNEEESCVDLRLSGDGCYVAGIFHQQEPRNTTLRVWDVIENRETLRFDNLPRPTSWAWHESSHTLAVANQEQDVLLFDYQSGVPQQRIEGSARPLAICFLGSNRLAISRDEALEVEVWNLSRLELANSLSVEEEITSLAWSSESKLLAAGSAISGEIYLWKLSEIPHQIARRLRGHYGRVTRMFFTAHGQVLASNSWDSTVRLWDAIGSTELLKIDAASVVSPGFGRNDQALVLSRHVNRITLANVSFDGPLHSLPRDHSDSHNWASCFHPTDDRLLAVATASGLVFWECQRREILAKVETGLVKSVNFTNDGRFVDVAGELGITRCHIDWNTDSKARVLKILQTEVLDPKPVYRASFQSDHSRFAAFVERERTAQVVDLTTSSVLSQTGEHRNLDWVIMSPDGRWLVTSTWGGSGLRVWNADNGELVQEMNSQNGSATIAFSPSGNWLAATDGQGQYLWRVADWELVHYWEREEPDGWPGPVTFSPDEKWIVFPQNRTTARLVDLESGKCLAILESPRRSSLSSYAVSPSGRYVAITHGEGIQIWDLAYIRHRLGTLGLDW